MQLGKVVLQEELDGLDLRVFQVLLEQLELLVSMAEQVQQAPMVLLELPEPRESLEELERLEQLELRVEMEVLVQRVQLEMSAALELPVH